LTTPGHVDSEDKDAVAFRDAIGREQKSVVINESGLYALILSSKLP
jgi:prophage antirepressor-like protein